MPTDVTAHGMSEEADLVATVTNSFSRQSVLNEFRYLRKSRRLPKELGFNKSAGNEIVLSELRIGVLFLEIVMFASSFHKVASNQFLCFRLEPGGASTNAVGVAPRDIACASNNPWLENGLKRSRAVIVQNPALEGANEIPHDLAQGRSSLR